MKCVYLLGASRKKCFNCLYNKKNNIINEICVDEIIEDEIIKDEITTDYMNCIYD